MNRDLTPGFFVRNGVFFPGASGAATMLFGFRVDAPELRLAGFRERDLVKASFRQLLQLIAIGETLEFHWGVSADFSAEFESFAAETHKVQNPVIRDHRWRTLQQLRQNPLRRHELSVFIQVPVAADRRGFWLQRRSADYFQTLIASQESKGVQFGERLDAIMRECGGSAQPLADLELFTAFHKCFNPVNKGDPRVDLAALFDPERSVLEQCWRSDLRGQGSQGFAMGHHYFKPLVLERPPTHTFSTILQPLLDQPFGDYSITVKLRRMSADQVIAREQKELDRGVQLLSKNADQRVAVARAMREERVRGLSQGDLIPVELEFLLVAWASSPEALARKVQALEGTVHALQGARLYAADLPASASKYFFKSLPGPMADHLSGIKLYAEDRWATDLFPVSTTATAHLEKAHAVYLGASGGPVGLLTSTGKGRDLMMMHSAWFGGTGMGKSEALNDFLHQTDPHVDLTFIIDNGYSLAPYVRSLGEEPVVVQAGGDVTVNFFETHGNMLTTRKKSAITQGTLQMTGRPKDEEVALAREALIAKYVVRLCEDFADDKIRGLSSVERDELVRLALLLHQTTNGQEIHKEQALSDFRRLQSTRPEEAEARLQNLEAEAVQAFGAEQQGDVRNLMFAFLRPDEHLTLSSFREFLELSGEGAESAVCELLAERLTDWCRGGSHGNLWDGASNVSFTGKRVVAFELSRISEANQSDKALASFLIANDIWDYFVAQPRELTKRWVIDEASAFLDMPHGEKILRELYERSRKLRIATITVWQQYGRIPTTSLRSAILGNSRAFFIFNPGNQGDLASLGADIGLSSVAQAAIMNYSRPAQHPDRNFSEFCYFEPDPHRPICTTIRHRRLPGFAAKASGPAESTSPTPHE